MIGVIDLPVLDQQWLGIDGQPTRLNGATVRTHDVSQLADARLTTTSTEALGDNLPRFMRLSEAARVTGSGSG